MIRFAFPLLALLFAAPALATPPDAEAEARALAEAWLAAWNAHDADAVVDLFADGALFAWPDGTGAALDDREAFRQGAAYFYSQTAAQHAHLAMEVERVFVHGETAIVFLRGTMDSDEMDASPAHTQLTLVRVGGAWKIAAEHAMVIQS